MESKHIATGILKALGVICSIVIVVWIVYQIQSLLIYCVIAAVVALLGRPMVFFLRRRLKFPNILAVIVTLICILSILVGIVALFVPIISDQSKNFALYDMDVVQEKFSQLIMKLSEAMGASKEVVIDIIEDADLENSVMENIDVGFIPKLFNALLGVLSSLGIGLFSVLFVSFFFLKDSQLIQRFILKLVPLKHQQKAVTSISKTKNLLSRYFVGILIQMSVIFFFYATGLLIAGIGNAIIIAFICALFNVIPYVGPLIGGSMMMLLAVTSNLEVDFYSIILPKAGYVFIAFVIGQLVDNFVSQPLIFSNSMKSHPLEIFIVIVGAGLLAGIMGLIIAVPAYTVIKVIFKEFAPQNRIVKVLTKDL